jgi:hypothetical protein
MLRPRRGRHFERHARAYVTFSNSKLTDFAGIFPA